MQENYNSDDQNSINYFDSQMELSLPMNSAYDPIQSEIMPSEVFGRISNNDGIDFDSRLELNQMLSELKPDVPMTPVNSNQQALVNPIQFLTQSKKSRDSENYEFLIDEVQQKIALERLLEVKLSRTLENQQYRARVSESNYSDISSTSFSSYFNSLIASESRVGQSLSQIAAGANSSEEPNSDFTILSQSDSTIAASRFEALKNQLLALERENTKKKSMILTQQLRQFYLQSQNYSTKFLTLLEKNCPKYPCFSQSLHLVPDCTRNILRYHQTTPKFVTGILCKENVDLLDIQNFYGLNLAWQKFNYVPQSVYKVLDNEVKDIWTDYRVNLENLRLNVPDFNCLFLNVKSHQRTLKMRKNELYSNLFLTMSLTQLKIKSCLQKYLDIHRLQMVGNKRDQTRDFINYMIDFKVQQQNIMKSSMDLVEQYGFQFFELIDEADFRKHIGVQVDQIRRAQDMLKSPYSVIRDLGKKHRAAIKSEFYRHIWSEIVDLKRKLFLQKGPFQIKLKKKIQTKNQLKKQEIKAVDVKKFAKEVLRLRWNYGGQLPKLNSPDMHQKVEKELPVCTEQEIKIESAFDCIYGFEKYSNQQSYIFAQDTHKSGAIPQQKNLADIILEDVIYESNKRNGIRASQLVYKTSEDHLPNLSYLEKNAWVYISSY